MGSGLLTAGATTQGFGGGGRGSKKSNIREGYGMRLKLNEKTKKRKESEGAKCPLHECTGTGQTVLNKNETGHLSS